MTATHTQSLPPPRCPRILAIMRCSNCGRQIHDDEEAAFDTTNIATGPGRRSAYTNTAPIWLCPDCSNYRRDTFHILYWILGCALAIGAFLAIIGALVN